MRCSWAAGVGCKWADVFGGSKWKASFRQFAAVLLGGTRCRVMHRLGGSWSTRTMPQGYVAAQSRMGLSGFESRLRTSGKCMRHRNTEPDADTILSRAPGIENAQILRMLVALVERHGAGGGRLVAKPAHACAHCRGAWALGLFSSEFRCGRDTRSKLLNTHGAGASHTGPFLIPTERTGMTGTALATFTGVITYVSGERGVVKHITHSRHGEPSGAVVRLDERSAVIYVDLGMRALVCTCGAEALARAHHSPRCLLMSNLSTNYREVLGWREIDRDEFDDLTGIASLRSEFGWDLA